MKKLLESLKNSDHPGGTYAAVIPSRKSAEDLYSFMGSLGIENLEDSDEYHCTLIYSEKPCPDVANEDFYLPFDCLPTKFSLFGPEKDTLVLEVYCPDATRLNRVFMKKHGATSNFDEYKPHITVAKNFTGKMPAGVPEFNIEFTGYMIEELG